MPLLVTRPLRTPLGAASAGHPSTPRTDPPPADRGRLHPAEALRAYRAYFGFLYGHLLTELQEVVVNPDETDDLLRLGLHRLPPREFPLVRALATDLAHYDGVAELDHGLDTLLAGLRPARP